MATGAQNLRSALDSVREKIATTAALLASPLKPDYSVDGQSVTHSTLMRQYLDLLEAERLLVEAVIRAEGPFEHVIRHTT